MPLYSFRCACGATRDEYRTVETRNDAPLCHGPMERVITPPMVSVFNSYRAIAGEQDGGERPYIRNKAEHAAFLRRNGYEEVGTDKSMAPPSCPEEIQDRQQKWKDAPDAPMVDVEKLKREGWLTEDLTV